MVDFRITRADFEVLSASDEPSEARIKRVTRLDLEVLFPSGEPSVAKIRRVTRCCLEVLMSTQQKISEIKKLGDQTFPDGILKIGDTALAGIKKIGDKAVS